MRNLAYRLHKMEPLLLFPPPVQGSRSIWQSGISLRSCSCCSIGAQQLPHRFPLSHELKAQTNTVVGMRLATVWNVNSTSHNVPHQSIIATNSRALEVYTSKHCAYFFVSFFDKACVIHFFPPSSYDSHWRTKKNGLFSSVNQSQGVSSEDKKSHRYIFLKLQSHFVQLGTVAFSKPLSNRCKNCWLLHIIGY